MGRKDIKGFRFGRWVAVDFAFYKDATSFWLCKCDCGISKVVRLGTLTSGTSKSCGCLQKEKVTTHGMKKSPEWGTWSTMRGRCYNQKTIHYADYGGRGITVCDEWRHSFEQFYKDMGDRPTSKHSLDRINNDGNYEPGNCRWATGVQQHNNTRGNVFITHNGEVKTVAQWCFILGLSRHTIDWGLNKGLSINEILIKKNNKNGTKNS